ncbi:hypothetical protein [Pseudonocardia sp.]|uniref:hypothetical protein n=1 Tax=Pseudonocardia sp. TaxID=60912 RepID=UPI002637F07E|nr:hypothetical protein [Pseudonocardia sp.]
MTTDPNSVVFVDAHEPALDAGGYEITVTQPLTGHVPVPLLPGTVVPTSLGPAPPTTRTRIHVLGPRVALEPSWTESRFPPAGPDGQDADVLAHVVLTRSTLPWERSALRGADTARAPWLAVLLLTEPEIAGSGGLPAVREEQVPFGSLRAPSAAPAFPGLGDEPGPADSEPVRVLDVPRGLLADLLPAASWLGHLTHVRERLLDSMPGALADDLDRELLPAALRELLREHGHAPDPGTRVRVAVPGAQWRIDGDTTHYVERAGPQADLAVTAQARAVVLGCRVTVPGRRYRAHLVSVEGRYLARPPGPGEPDDGEEFRFDFGAATAPDDPVRLVLLDRWDFGADAGAERLRDLLRGLAGTGTGPSGPAGLTVPVEGRSGAGVDMLRAGHALLPHRLRNGGRVRSWYRGPLVARLEEPPLPPPPHDVADALLAVDRHTGMLLTSHAAAWELGRTLALADPSVARDLVRWKTEHRRHAHRRATAADTPHLEAPTGEAPGPPPAVLSFMRRLLVLDGVPFGYLVPDPAMLPPESLRTFRLDPGWLGALLDGVFGAGRSLRGDPGTERDLLFEIMQAAAEHLVPEGAHTLTVSGCLVRSEVVSAWPALHVDGWVDGDRTGRCPVLRRARLSDDVLLVLFLGDVALIELHPDPESLHHGLVPDDRPGGPPGWRIVPRHLDGVPDAEGPGPAPMRPREVLDVAAARARPGGSGVHAPDEFALRLLAGVPRLSVQVPPAH